MSHLHLAVSSGNGAHPADSAQLQKAIIEAFLYADLFSYPLARHEVVRYLGVPADPGAVGQALEHNVSQGRLARANGYFTLAGREELIEVRERRGAIARRKWAAARRYVHWLALLPFVRMVAVTGTLAVDNVEEGDDIDLFIVTSPDRLWLCRALSIVVVRLVRLLGDELCPNYFVSERQLAFPAHNFFVAREVAQMVPVYGIETYRRIRQLNHWVADFLPQAGDAPEPAAYEATPGARTVAIGRLGRGLKRLGESLLGGALGGRLERWEMKRKVRKLNETARAADALDSAAFTADCCKGHFDHHDQSIMDRFQDARSAKNAFSANGSDPAG